MKTEKTITICCSASFYRQALEAEETLRKAGFRVLIPDTAYRMRETGNFDVSAYKTWFADERDWGKKADFMRRHFGKVQQGDAILVLNLEKNGIAGYIGGNVLMEMALAFHHKKPIYVLHSVSTASPVYEEILGMLPVFLNGNLENLS